MKFLNRITGRTGASPTLSSEESANIGLSLKAMAQVMEHFPIGTRLQYYPEYQKETKIDTIIVAYVVNDFVVYSNRDIQFAETGPEARTMRITQKGNDLPLDRVFSFDVLIPHIERKEIDYARSRENNAAEVVVPTEKNANDFKRGNSITLFCRNARAKGILQVDTEVKKSVVFNSGLYAKRKLVLLTPALESFECVDLRRFNRINTEIPAEIYLESKRTKGECLLQDFSERFVRVEIAKAHRTLHHSLEEGSSVALRISASLNGDQEMVLRGTVYRKRKENVVISLQNLLKQGRFQAIDELDELFIKAAMLEHPNTERE
ncbi:MAG: PilZ domain-containing protein [Thermodesulfobacteriota bacterium]